MTTTKGGTLSRIAPPDPLPESADPTAACANWEPTPGYVASDDSLVYGECGALLTLELAEVSSG